MRWVQIEPDGELPAEGETILVLDAHRQWSDAEYSDGHFYWEPGGEIHGATHWLRVMLPE